MKFVIVLFLVSPFLSFAQSRPTEASAGNKPTPMTPALRGKIADQDHKSPIHFATISLLRSDSTVLAGQESKEDGGFSFAQVPAETFMVRVSFVGYDSWFKTFPAGRKTPLNLGALALHPNAAQLQTVIVSAEKSAFKTEIDKKVFNVDKSLASKGGTAVDALRQVPTLHVSASGNILLRNGAPVILLDGKRTTLSLDQIPADQIQSVEVMPNPSARYDAQGNNGIVNIVMKKNRRPGLNGSITGVWNSLGENYEFLNLNAYKRRWNFTFNYMGHHHRNAGTTTTTRTDLTNNTSLVQYGRDETTGPFHKLRMGADFFMDEHNTFSLSGDIGIGSHPTTTSQLTDYKDAAGLIDSSSRRNTDAGRKFTFSHATLDYEHAFRRQGEKLTASAAIEAYDGPENGTYSMQYLDKNGSATTEPALQQYQSSIRAHTITLQSDYTNSFHDGHGRLETGLKASIHRDHSLNLLSDYDSNAKQYIENSIVSYNYKYADNTYAAYASVNDQLGNFSYMAGLRFEQFDYKGSMLDTTLNFAYHTTGFYPSLFLTEKLGAHSDLHLNYSRRLNRPDFPQVSPRTDYSNPQDLQRGNPDLQPESTNLLELAYNTMFKTSSLNTTLFVKNTLHAITNYSMPISPDTLLSTYMNANSSNTYGAEIVFKIPVLKWWTATTNLNLYQTSINANNLSKDLSNAGFSWFAKFNSDMKIMDILTFQLTGNYSAAQVMAQGKTLGYGGMDAAIKKDLLKSKAASIVISLSDILNTEKERVRTYSENLFIQEAINKPITRVLKINFTYTFGKERSKPAA